jgi:DNA-binding MarR family transcriptional regulator
MSNLSPARYMGVTVLEERALVALVQAAATAAEASDAVVRSEGLSPSQYNVLRILRSAGSNGLTRTDIAERMVTRDPDMTRLLWGLDSKGLVTTWRSTSDARQRVSGITNLGRSLLRELDPRVTEAVVRSVGHLPRRKLEDLVTLLDDLSTRRSRDNPHARARATG